MKKALCVLMLLLCVPCAVQASEAPLRPVGRWQATGADWQPAEAEALARTLLGAGELDASQGWTRQESLFTNARGETLLLTPGSFTYRHPLFSAYELAAYPHWNAGQWRALEPVNLSEVPPLEGMDITRALALVADALLPLGLTLDAPSEVQVWNADALARSAGAWRGLGSVLPAEAASLSPCYRLWLPVCYQGLRLGPGLATGPQGDASMAESTLVLALVNQEGLVELLAEDLLLSDFTPLENLVPPMDEQAALARFQQLFLEPEARVEGLHLQYLYAWQQRPGISRYTYTLRPVWCVYARWEEDIEYQGLPPLPGPARVLLDAVTGELIEP